MAEPPPPAVTAMTAMVAEVQVTAPRLAPSPAERAFSIIELGPDDLAAAVRLDDALGAEPGVALFRRTGSEAANPTIQGLSLRAFAPSGAGRALVTLDGAPQNDPFGGWVIWSALPPEGLAGAQIVKGAGAGPYGAGALTGTVALQERDPREGLSALDVSAGDYGAYRAAAAFGSANLLAVVAGQSQQGYVPVRGERRGAVDEPAGLDQVSASARLQGEVGILSAALRLDAFEERRGGGVQGVGSQASGGGAALSLAGPSGDGGGWRAQAWVRTSDLKNRFAAVAAGRATSQPAAEQTATPALGYGLNAAWRGGTAGWTWEAGADLRVAEGETQEFFRYMGGAFTRGRIAGGRTLVGGAYAEATHEGPRLLLTGGARLDGWSASEARRIERDLDGGAMLLDSRAPDRSGTTPTARLGARLALGEQSYLRTAAYSGFRPPTLNELHRPFRVGNDITEANPALEPERLYGVEAALGAQGAFWSWSAGLFLNRLEDPVVNVTVAEGPGTFPVAGFIPAGGVLRERRNVGHIEAWGVELSARGDFGPWSLKLDAAHVAAEMDGGDQAPQLTGLRPAQTPETVAVVSFDWRAASRLTLSGQARYEGRRFEDDLNQRALDAAVTADLRVAWRMGAHGEAYMAVDNAFDADVEAAASGDGLITLAAPRTVRVGYAFRR